MGNLEVKLGMDRQTLKYIAVIAMIIDHIAMCFISISNPLYGIFRFIGRITAPIMCYFLVEGFQHTSSKKKYFIRLFVFALISQVPYVFCHYNKLVALEFNMIFNLFLCFCILLSYTKIRNSVLKVLSIIFLMMLSLFCDWSIIAPLWVLMFYIYKDSFNKKMISFSIIAMIEVSLVVIFCIINKFPWYRELWQVGVYLSIPFIYLYNGKGGKNTFCNRWFFYIVYPLHLFLFGLIRWVL
ncbi:conjugal transfer protein TraX [Clostridium bornimense]|uniref:TraX family protein n=1 Tax=Clostridium bornimense TaxID=1216932 RepID=UPI001C123B05|nr:TraX family protein [Clostridium bornimense]MBU5314920.1 conjugal transfer protein TraX [Clostridium bornimense]